MLQMDDHTMAQCALLEKYALEREDSFYRWGTRMLRGGKCRYSPCVLDRREWENHYLSLPLDYDIRNDPVFDLKRSSYERLGDLGFSWPEPTTKEALRTGYCGPDSNSLTRPAFLRFRENDCRPEPAHRLHLTDRASLHLMRADPLEGVVPFGRQGDMTSAKSVSHRDFKWRRACCAKPPTNPTYERTVHRTAKTDLTSPPEMVDQVLTFRDDIIHQNFSDNPLLKLKKAYQWPINPITSEPLGGRLVYYAKDPCQNVRDKVWFCGEGGSENKDCNPMIIPDQRCDLLAHGKKDKPQMRPVNQNNSSVLDLRFPAPNWECWEEVPENCKRDLPSECCFQNACTKDPPPANSQSCPPKPNCPC